ncbi:MAG: response regulator [Candidatus Doudnabacteria bacterium]|nr:response regulator [Candidatus Doudnabacteria bacterium]
MKNKILIVEDDLSLADVLANKLKLEGFEPSIAPDGQVAMDLLDKEVYELILLDLSMPWYDGFHVLEDLKNKPDFKTPIVIMSNLAGTDDINRVKSLGAADYLVKTSVTPELIVKEIHKFIK